MSTTGELTVVVPCYNEEQTIPTVIPALLAHCREHHYTLIVVNDGSIDNSPALLKEFAAPDCRIIHHKVNRGYGAALKTGLLAAETPWAVTVDADGQHRMNDVDTLLEAAKNEDADLVVGARPASSSGIYRSFGKWVIRTFAAMLLKLPVKDMNSGMKLYLMPEARPYLTICPDGMAFSDTILLLMVNDRKKVIEKPIAIVPRQGGVSTIGARTAFETIVELINLTMLLKPMKVCLILGSMLLIAGVLWGTRTYILNHTLTTMASMLVLSALLVFFIGFIAEQIALLRRECAGLRKK